MIIYPSTASYHKCPVKGQQTHCALAFLTVAQNHFVPRLSLTVSRRHLSSLHLSTNLRIPFAPPLSPLSILTPQTSLIQSP